MNDLHNAIMNITSEVPDACKSFMPDSAYKLGHRDARHAAAELALTHDKEMNRLQRLLNTPELHNFSHAVVLEAAHQRERWGSSHDAGKTPSDWFWLVGYLAGKALAAHITGNKEKALHHTISTAAALSNWHSAILGLTDMRPGIIPPEENKE